MYAIRNGVSHLVGPWLTKALCGAQVAVSEPALERPSDAHLCVCCADLWRYYKQSAGGARPVGFRLDLDGKL